jgi:hypothetical protein
MHVDSKGNDTNRATKKTGEAGPVKTCKMVCVFGIRQESLQRLFYSGFDPYM